MKVTEEQILSYCRSIPKKTEVVKALVHKYGLSQTAIYKRLKNLENQGKLKLETDNTYKVIPDVFTKTYEISGSLEEDKAFQDLDYYIHDLPENVLDILYYGFTEMFNNALEHSNAKKIRVLFIRRADNIIIIIHDDGIGIFKKITDSFDNIQDEDHAVLEISKGKITTNPDDHTGEGIFFTSWAFDIFFISSNNKHFFRRLHRTSNNFSTKIHDIPNDSDMGTFVYMQINKSSDRKLEDVFNKYTVGDDVPIFNITEIDASLVAYKEKSLISRSQARRLLHRLNNDFKQVTINFEDITSIGQGFADEIFRVFPKRNPGIEIKYINAAPKVEWMIKRAIATGQEPEQTKD